MRRYICVGPTDPDYNDENHINDKWHEQYTDLADASWVWQSFRLCRRTPRKLILSRAVIMAWAMRLAEDVIALSEETASCKTPYGLRLVRQ